VRVKPRCFHPLGGREALHIPEQGRPVRLLPDARGHVSEQPAGIFQEGGVVRLQHGHDVLAMLKAESVYDKTGVKPQPFSECEFALRPDQAITGRIHPTSQLKKTQVAESLRAEPRTGWVETRGCCRLRWTHAGIPATGRSTTRWQRGREGSPAPLRGQVVRQGDTARSMCLPHGDVAGDFFHDVFERDQPHDFA